MSDEQDIEVLKNLVREMVREVLAEQPQPVPDHAGPHRNPLTAQEQQDQNAYHRLLESKPHWGKKGGR